MEINFAASLKHVLEHEGGWVDHPRDPGGATMKGVTLLTYRRHFGDHKSKRDLRKITEEELGSIYRSGYWDKCRCDALPLGVDYAVFDAAVNSGPWHSARWLQTAVGAEADGSIGAKTLAKVAQQDAIQITRMLCDQRLNFLRGLDTWETFGRGWGARVEAVRVTSVAMAKGETVANRPVVDYQTTQKGSSGAWVRKLQQALEIQVDGKFGRDTEAALKTWQHARGLEADGVAGRVTYRALGLLA